MSDKTYSAEELKAEAQRAAREAVDDLKSGARRVADEARATVDDLTNNSSVERLRERGAEMADSVRERGHEYADIARQEARRLYRKGERRAHEVAHQAEDYYDEVSTMVRRNPAQALGIAAGVGFLIGLILARR